MDESEEDKNNQRFSQEQYEMLKRCSEKKDIREWNERRKENTDEGIWLQGADLRKANLQGAKLEKANLHEAFLRKANLQEAELGGANLQEANLRSANLQGADLRDAHLENANLWSAHLENANLRGAHLENANLGGAHLENANLRHAHLENADLGIANLENASLWRAHLENANFSYAHLENADLEDTYLENADLGNANLKGAKLEKAELQGASFKEAIVDSSTSILRCYVDRNTNFRDMSLDSLRSESGTKYLLKYNIRRLNWEDWYEDHPLPKWPVKTFWAISDYGRSTGRVVGTFFILALFFAAVYANCAYWCPPGAVSDLAVEPHFPLWHYFLLVLLRPVCFSVVTMTTLGFGDMHAHVQSVLGHILLTIQVLFGYVLLGALVTRLAVLFTADGPEGSFTPMSEETKQLLEKLKKDKQKQ